MSPAMAAFSSCAWLVLVCFWTPTAHGDRPVLPGEMPLGANRPMHASVYGEPSTRYGSGVKQIVELLRFVTGYGAGMEVLVDVSPQAPLLDALSQSKEVQAFAFIDTWVGQKTGWVEDEYLVVPDVRNGTGLPKCELRLDEHRDQNDGNGMALSAELVLWEQEEGVTDVRPRETITLASGPAGGSYDVGTIRYYEGWSIDEGRQVLLDEPADFGGPGSEVAVYPCPEGGLTKARQMFLWVRDATKRACRPELLTEFLDHVRQELIEEQMVDLKVKRVCPETHALICEYTPGLELQPSMPVFVKDGELRAKFQEHRRQKLYKKHIGKVVWVADVEFAVQLDIDCVPSEATAGKPHLQVPSSPRYEEKAEKVVRALEAFAMTRRLENYGGKTVEYSEYLGDVSLVNGTNVAATQKVREGVPDALADAPPFWPKFWHLRSDEMLEPLALLGRVEPGEGPCKTLNVRPSRRHPSLASSLLAQGGGGGISPAREAGDAPNAARREGGDAAAAAAQREGGEGGEVAAASAAPEDGDAVGAAGAAPSFFQEGAGHGRRVCVVDEHRSGLIFDRKFDAPAMDAGDRVLMQIVVTGHGWQRTDLQCGEFCHVMYHLNFNDETGFNVMMWRDDCKNNPLGDEQNGTWQNERNGWCPGSVETGIYVDITEALHEGRNELMVGMYVWNEKTRRYDKPYTNPRGYRFNDTAKLVFGMTLSVYPKAAVRAIRAQHRFYTAAEKALRLGTSVKSALLQMQAAERKMAASFLQQRSEIESSSGGRGKGQGQAAGSAGSAGSTAGAKEEARHGSAGGGEQEEEEASEAAHEARIREGLRLLKHLALQQGTRTPAGVLVSQPVRRGRKTPAPAHTSALEKSSLKSEWDNLLAQHHLLMSDEEVREMLQRAKSGGLRDEPDAQEDPGTARLEQQQQLQRRPRRPRGATLDAVATGEHLEAESPNERMQLDHVAMEAVAVKYGNVFPGDQVMYIAEQHVRNTTIVATDTIVMVKKVEVDQVLVHFPYGEVLYVRYEELRFIVETKPDSLGTCDKACESEYTDLLGAGSCRDLIEAFDQSKKTNVSKEEIMDRINKACDDQCHCDRSDIFYDGSNLPDYSGKCQALVRPVRVSDAFEDTVHYDEREGAIMDYWSAQPWYCYSTAQEGPVGDNMDGQRVYRVKIFDRTNFHVGRQTAVSTLKNFNIPDGFKWGRAALHLRIDHPRWPGFHSDGTPWSQEIDQWDRLGTLGFQLPGSTEQLALFPADENKKRQWVMKPAQDQNQIFRILQHEMRRSKMSAFHQRMKRRLRLS